MEPSGPLSQEQIAEAVEAHRMVVAFLGALADDNGAALEQILLPPTRAKIAADTSGLAMAVRTAYGLTREQAALMGVSTTVRVLRDGMLVFVCVPTTMGRAMIVSDPMPTGVYFGVWKHEGSWRIWGTPSSSEMELARLVELPVAMRPEGFA